MNINLISILMDALFITILLWCSYTDLKSRTISNLSIILLLCLGLIHLVLAILSGSVWWIYPVGILLGIPFFLAWMKGYMGAGDVKLVAVLGLYFGVWDILLTFTFIIPVFIVILILSWVKTKRINCLIPIIPVLVLGTISTVLLEYL